MTLRNLTDPRYLQPAVETVARLLKEPSFAPDAVEQVAPANADGAPERAQSPSAIAQDAFFKALYGDHPYGSPADGTPASLNAITRADIPGLPPPLLHRRQCGRRHRRRPRPTRRRAIGPTPWSAACPERTDATPPVPPLAANPTIRIPHPSAKAISSSAQLGVSRADPDYYALYLGNHVLGGNGLVSQLSPGNPRKAQGWPMAPGAFFADAANRPLPDQSANPQRSGGHRAQVAQTTLHQFSTDGPRSSDVGEPARTSPVASRSTSPVTASWLSGADRVLRSAVGLPANLHRHHERHQPGAGQDRLAAAYPAPTGKSW